MMIVVLVKWWVPFLSAVCAGMSAQCRLTGAIYNAPIIERRMWGITTAQSLAT